MQGKDSEHVLGWLPFVQFSILYLPVVCCSLQLQADETGSDCYAECSYGDAMVHSFTCEAVSQVDWSTAGGRQPTNGVWMRTHPFVRPLFLVETLFPSPLFPLADPS